MRRIIFARRDFQMKFLATVAQATESSSRIEHWIGKKFNRALYKSSRLIGGRSTTLLNFSRSPLLTTKAEFGMFANQFMTRCSSGFLSRFSSISLSRRVQYSVTKSGSGCDMYYLFIFTISQLIFYFCSFLSFD